MGTWGELSRIAGALCLFLAVAAPGNPAGIRSQATNASCPERLARESQLRAVHELASGRRVEEFLAPSQDVALLHPTIVEALAIANDRFTETRPEDPVLVFTRQKQVDPSVTRYFVLKGAGDRVVGMGLLVDGTRGERVPTEKEFPAVDFRHRPQEARPVELIEVARLATDGSEKGSLRHLFAAMANRIAALHGEGASCPSNLRIVLWTSAGALVPHYREKYGFELWEDPRSLGEDGRWVMGMTARDFLDRYLGR